MQAKAWPESELVYAAALFLRKQKMKVHRVSGFQSRLDGRLVNNDMLKTLAHELGWDGKPR